MKCLFIFLKKKIKSTQNSEQKIAKFQKIATISLAIKHIIYNHF